MSDKYIEKTFLWLVLASVLVHAAILAIVIYFPAETKPPVKEPYMVDLRDLPPSPEQPPRPEHETRRLDDRRRRIYRETAPRDEMDKNTAASSPRPPASTVPQTSQNEADRLLRPAEQGAAVMKEKPGEDFFRRKVQKGPDLARLFPSAEKQAELEEGFRKKYSQEVAEGESKFLNPDDLQFGSFYHRLESAIYGVWRYPAEAARLGIEGVTPVRITFNRQGEVIKVEILQSSGSKILDDEVKRTLKMIGPVGGFPRGYDKETFNLIAFFHYNMVRGMIQGTLN
jgi:periplasmic protein TonB